MALLTEVHTDWSCFFALPPETSKLVLGSQPGASRCPAMKVQTSVDSSQEERPSVEICISASSAHGSARTEAQRLGLLACLATSNFKRSFGGPCQAPPAALLRKCERLQIPRSQKGLGWKALAQPHLPMALLAHRHSDWGCLLILPLQTSNVARGSLPGASSSPAPKMQTSPDSSQPEGASLESCCSTSSAHGTARTEAQRLGLLACLATSNFKRSPPLFFFLLSLLCCRVFFCISVLLPHRSFSVFVLLPLLLSAAALSVSLLLPSPPLWDCLSPSFSRCSFACFMLSGYTSAVQPSVTFLLSRSGLHPAPHFWQPLPSSASLQEPTDRLFPAGAMGAAPGRTAEVSEGQREHWGAPSPRAERLPGLAGCVTE